MLVQGLSLIPAGLYQRRLLHLLLLLQTLLDVLAGRKNAGVCEGTMLYGGQRPSLAFLRRFTGISRRSARLSFQGKVPFSLLRDLLRVSVDAPCSAGCLLHTVASNLPRTTLNSCSSSGYVEQFDTLIGVLTVREMVREALE